MMVEMVTVTPNIYEPLVYANCLRAYSRLHSHPMRSALFIHILQLRKLRVSSIMFKDAKMKSDDSNPGQFLPKVLALGTPTTYTRL